MSRYRDGKGTLFEGGCRVAGFANWSGRIKPQTDHEIIHAVDIYPTFAGLAGASTAGCKPLMGSESGESPAGLDIHGHPITDESIGEVEARPTTH